MPTPGPLHFRYYEVWGSESVAHALWRAVPALVQARSSPPRGTSACAAGFLELEPHFQRQDARAPLTLVGTNVGVGVPEESRRRGEAAARSHGGTWRET